MSNFWQRTLTGAAFVVTVVVSVFLGAWWFSAFFSLVVFVGMMELRRMMDADQVRSQKAMVYVLGLSVWTLSTLELLAGIDGRFWLLLVPLVVCVFVIELYRAKERPFWNVASTLLIPFYVVVPFVFLQKLAFVGGDYNPYMVLSFFGMVWVNDTGAYLVGVTMGRHRLFPRISPKKSWEGFVGGVLLTVALSYGLSHWIVGYAPALWLAVGFVVAVFGTLGDLTESMLKRTMDVKDSGTILPGHGGVLDRFDAFTFAAPFVYVLFEIFK
ncbi:MAG: phosphatidate cytidylyltransferase [Breznakibacter sp.]